MKITQVFFFVVLAGLALSCNAQSSQDSEQSDDSQVKAENVQLYYFHMTRRCATCKAVEDVSKQAVKEMDGKNVSFSEYNVEKPEGEEKAKKLDVHGQALLIVSGDKKINLTREGFMHARTNPEKFKEIVQQKINSL